MSAESVIFYLLAVTIIGLGAMCVFTRNILRSAVFLLLALVGVAGLYILMNMNFMAALQIMIYVGGIVVLIIFSIFLTHNTGQKLALPIKRRLLVGISIPLSGFLLLLWVMMQHPYKEVLVEDKSLDIHQIGLQLFNITDYGYIFPFEMVSILMLAALIGSIVVALKK